MHGQTGPLRIAGKARSGAGEIVNGGRLASGTAYLAAIPEAIGFSLPVARDVVRHLAADTIPIDGKVIQVQQRIANFMVENAIDLSREAKDRQVTDWRTQGVRVIPGNSLDSNTAQTPGMNRAAAINFARVGAQKIWAGTVHIHPGAKTGAHHHGELESVIYIVRGRARMRWGEKLEFVAEAGPGDFIFVPPFVPHQEINASADETLECVLVRSDNEATVVNLDITPVEKPDAVKWVDPIHR